MCTRDRAVVSCPDVTELLLLVESHETGRQRKL